MDTYPMVNLKHGCSIYNDRTTVEGRKVKLVG